MRLKNPAIPTKNTLQKEILQEITESFMEEILDQVYQNAPNGLKKFQDTKNKEYEKIQRQVNNLSATLNKHQSETEHTINREINELR
jgi:oligoendopeptidase F